MEKKEVQEKRTLIKDQLEKVYFVLFMEDCLLFATNYGFLAVVNKVITALSEGVIVITPASYVFRRMALNVVRHILDGDIFYPNEYVCELQIEALQVARSFYPNFDNPSEDLVLSAINQELGIPVGAG